MTPQNETLRWRPRTLVRAVAMAGGATYWATRHPGIPWALLAGVLLGLMIVAFASPPTYAPVEKALDRFMEQLLQGFTWLILAVLFFLVMVPAGLASRLAGKRSDSDAVTWWEKPKSRQGKGTFETLY